MGFRFRKRIKLMPGLSLNLSARGLGLSAGIPGAHISANTSGRVTRSIGVPGTGMGFVSTSTIGGRRRSSARSSPRSRQDAGQIPDEVLADAVGDAPGSEARQPPTAEAEMAVELLTDAIPER